MSAWTEVFLGVIAVATLVTAVVQVGVIIAAAFVVRRVGRLADRVERELKPLFGHLDAIGRDASRAALLAAAQVERVDKLFGELAGRVEQTLNRIQASITGPAREGRAILEALRAAIAVILRSRDRRGRQGRGDEEDALFI